MKRRFSRYSCECSYVSLDGKIHNLSIGPCTTADGEAYAALMEACGDDASLVLKRYAYFSVELKAILEKAAELQAMKQLPAKLLRRKTPILSAKDYEHAVKKPDRLA